MSTQKYHVKPDGTVGKCNAVKRNCPYQQFDTIEEARTTADKITNLARMKNEYKDVINQMKSNEIKKDDKRFDELLYKRDTLSEEIDNIEYKNDYKELDDLVNKWNDGEFEIRDK